MTVIAAAIILSMSACSGSKAKDDKKFDLNLEFKSSECEFQLRNTTIRDEGQQNVEVNTP